MNGNRALKGCFYVEANRDMLVIFEEDGWDEGGLTTGQSLKGGLKSWNQRRSDKGSTHTIYSRLMHSLFWQHH